MLCLFDRFRKQLGARGLMSTPNLNRWIKYYYRYFIVRYLYSLHTRYTACQKPLCCVIRDLGSVDASWYVGTSISPVAGWTENFMLIAISERFWMSNSKLESWTRIFMKGGSLFILVTSFVFSHHPASYRGSLTFFF